MMTDQMNIQYFLKKRLEEGKDKNSAYSLRSFAVKLGISSSALSEILNGKRRVSYKMAEKLASKMGLGPNEKNEFLGSIQTTLTRDSKYRKVNLAEKNKRQLLQSEFEVVANWVHFAILNLLKTKDVKSDHAYMAQRLGVSETEIIKCITNLLKLNLIKINEQGQYERSASPLKTSEGIVSASIQRSHLNDLELIKAKMPMNPTVRDYTSFTLPVNPKKLHLAHQLIRRAQDEIYELMAQDGEFSEVYRICSYMFPLTQVDEIKILNQINSAKNMMENSHE